MKKKFDLWVHLYPTLKKLIMELKIAFFIIVVSVSNVLGYSYLFTGSESFTGHGEHEALNR